MCIYIYIYISASQSVLAVDSLAWLAQTGGRAQIGSRRSEVYCVATR